MAPVGRERVSWAAGRGLRGGGAAVLGSRVREAEALPCAALVVALPTADRGRQQGIVTELHISLL